MWLALFVAVALAQNTRPGVCSNFLKVWEAYPGDDVPSDELLASLGGGMIGMANTCAIRTTIAFRSLNLEAGQIANARWRDAAGRRYLIRVLEMNQFMRATFGPPRWTGGPGVRTDQVDDMGEAVFLHPASLRGNSGVIRYSDCPFADATGHFDVWNGETLKGHGYPHKCRKMEVWDVCNPVSQPNYAEFQRYMRSTNGWDPRGTPQLPSAPLPSASNGRPAPAPAAVDVRRAQELLNRIASRTGNAALNAGVADGIAGRRTAAAVRAFQNVASLPATGVLDSATMAALAKF